MSNHVVVDQAPEGPERDALEIALATLGGMVASHVHGYGPLTRGAFQRACSLLRNAPQHPMLRRLLHGFEFVLSLRADYAEALAVADRAEALASETTIHQPVHAISQARRSLASTPVRPMKAAGGCGAAAETFAECAGAPGIVAAGATKR